ncbi:divergent protein kinase domain 2A-like [Artemia franciscana]
MEHIFGSILICLIMPIKGKKITLQSYLIALMGVSCLLSIYKTAFPVFVDLKDKDLLDLQKCPSCYGVNMCPAIITGEIRLVDWSQYTIGRFMNARNVYFGDFRNSPVVMKKLGHDWELEELDNAICIASNLSVGCEVNKAIRSLTKEVTDEIFVPDIGGGPSGHIDYKIQTEDIGNGSDFLHCSSSRKTQFIMDKILKKNHGQHQITIIENIITLMMINEEALIGQAFPYEEGFPFPKYYGACGRLVIEELVNRTIADFVYSAWESRAAVAYRLLGLAERMTNISSNFSLYWTDVTEHNLGLDEKNNPLILDAENIIIVDLEEVETVRAGDWDVPFTSEGVGCESCFSYNVDNLCYHAKTDHNIYALCHGLLSPGAFSHRYPQGLLYNIPEYVLQKFPELPSLLEECKWPKNDGGRFKAATELMKILEEFKDLLSNS